MPPSDIDDESVDRLIANAKYIAKTRLHPLSKCAFFGTHCSDALVVPVVVQVDKAEMNPGRPYDLLFRTYINMDHVRRSIAFNLDKFMIEVEDWPGGREVQGEWMWTIFVSRYVLDEDNQLIRSLHGGDDLEVPGSIIVAKSDRSGHNVDVETADLYFIKCMLVDVLSREDP